VSAPVLKEIQIRLCRRLYTAPDLYKQEGHSTRRKLAFVVLSVGHEGNKALMQALGGEWAEDRALADDLKKEIVRARKPVQNGLGVGGSAVPVVNEAEPR
jgi:hypothetical protein